MRGSLDDIDKTINGQRDDIDVIAQPNVWQVVAIVTTTLYFAAKALVCEHIAHRVTDHFWVDIHDYDELQIGTDHACIDGGCWSNNPSDGRSTVRSSDIVQTVTDDTER